MTHVLLVEDDVEIARIIKYYLSLCECYEIVWAKNKEEVHFYAKDHFDVILLDIMLPDANGIELCRSLRKEHLCPIIFISCLDDADTIISALDMGGDDYLVKPFDVHILHARIQANLRRVEMDCYGTAENRLSCCGFTLDANKHTVIRNGQSTELVPLEFKILSFLMQHPRQTFRSSELYAAIWGNPSYGDTRTVAVHIFNLRRKIEENAAEPQYLKSIWGKGYMFDPDGSAE